MGMAKLVTPPDYTIKRGKPTCEHEIETITLGSVKYHFCEECKVCWIEEESKRC
jgi:hypothetical protein